MGGARCHYTPPEDPYNEMYIVKDTLGNPVEGFAYKIETDEGKVYRGVTNEKGETIRIGTGHRKVDLTFSENFDEDGE
ncbi:hypothetical protein [Psychrobacter sp.]|uniref:hypothetical protein n=1 Tax=unclassified Psychrobacter TaxID=196806 RepID=UPI003F999BC8